ncbi:hypothetical protein RFI_22356 [Reticulomyxa filosa]|uniref:Uncharacterized protein n=1 Tax=Reticulomyxa filosa TaxID=46433 RepID=X6MME4_RETFI|nr:hypothetical protein RFI_22356 [Reticulomyxa filosa]|eukprot:ETO15014.1 hypothetical protein RFI_22356 [Reticulomyxa filosa]
MNKKDGQCCVCNVRTTMTQVQVGENELSEQLRKMSRQELETDLVDLREQIEAYEVDLSNLRVELADHVQLLDEESKERVHETEKLKNLSVMTNSTIDKYAIAQNENERLKQQLEMIKFFFFSLSLSFIEQIK